MASLVIVIILYVIAAVPGFFAINDPSQQNARAAFHPPQGIHLFDRAEDGSLQVGLYFHPHKLARDPETLAAVYKEDPARKIAISLFGRGYSLFGPRPVHHRPCISWPRPTRSSRCSCSAPTGSAAASGAGSCRAPRSRCRSACSACSCRWPSASILGGISGYYGGKPDFVIQRVIEFVLALPTIPIWLAMAAALPQDWPAITQYFMITVILSLTGWAQLARVVRGRFLSLRTEEFVTAARLDGCSEGRIIFRHMMPSFLSHIIASVTLAIPAMILAETALSFLGLGLQPPTISWGVLLREAQNIRSIATAPWLFAPGAFVVVAVMALNLLGDGLRDAADPYNK